SSPGPKLFGMSGHVNKPGVYEDELGITLDYAINKLAGGMKGGKFKGSICGGISMGVLGPNQLDIKLDFDDVRFRGGCLGLGTAWATRTFINKYYDEFAAACPENRVVPLTIKRGQLNVLSPMGSNTR